MCEGAIWCEGSLGTGPLGTAERALATLVCGEQTLIGGQCGGRAKLQIHMGHYKRMSKGNGWALVRWSSGWSVFSYTKRWQVLVRAHS